MTTSPISLRARVGGALRLLLAPRVKPGRVIGAADADTKGAVVPSSPCPPGPILSLDRCPLCGHAERTAVSEFNRFVHFARPPDEESLRADYALCHGCGALYATRRPAGSRYQWLLDHFEESLGRADSGPARPGKYAISSRALSDEDRAHLRRLASRGVFVSEHARLSRKDYLPALLGDRLAASVHIEILGSLLDLEGRRVLEVRSRLGSLPASLKRLYGADVAAMAIFEGQQFLINEVYGIPASRIDFDAFDIPFEGSWDLIVCNHMLTHAVRPGEMLATLRARLSPGGHVYFYNEPDDAEFLEEGRSMFNTLNAFHLQTFDGPAVVRALEANGFRTTFLTHHEGNIVCLAQADEGLGEWSRIAARDLQARVKAYLAARDAALLMLPESARWRVESEWKAVVGRTLESGVAEFSPEGFIKIRRS